MEYEKIGDPLQNDFSTLSQNIGLKFIYRQTGKTIYSLLHHLAKSNRTLVYSKHIYQIFDKGVLG